MEEKKEIKISLTTFIIVLIIFTAIIGGLIYYIVNTKAINKSNDTNINASNITRENNLNEEELKSENLTNNSVSKEDSNYFILYNGYEIEKKVGIQNLSEMKVNAETNKKYDITYYNYENGKYTGAIEGNFGEEIYEGVSIVNNVEKIAISQKYDAVPRKHTTVNELPDQLKDMADYTTVDIQAIDLDGDNKTEYIVCYTLNYAEGEIGEGEPEASSGIILLDSNYKKIADLVTLENGFWGNIKTEDKKVFLSIKDVDYIDVDKDSIMEILIKVPTYEGNKISILKYNNGNLEGETGLKASVMP